MFLRLNIISAGHCNIWSQESVQLEKVNPPINISRLDSTQEPRTLQWSTTTWGDEMLTYAEMGVNCWKNSTAVLHWIRASVFFFIVFSGSVQNVFLHICFYIDDMFLSFNHEAMLPHFMKCHCSVFNIQIPFPFLTPCDQEVLVPFWEKSVGAPSPTWWLYTRLVKLMKWALWSHH